MASSRLMITAHARSQMARRGISEDVVALVASEPEQRIATATGREVRQSIVRVDQRWYLVRVVVDVVGHDTEVVNVYGTSNVGRYWRSS